jgi:co-chaperonin GroES (HSP10)
MKRCSLLVIFLATACLLLGGFVHAGAAGTETRTGKVIAVDPEGKAIVIDVGSGKEALDVGTVINADTKLKVKGKSMPLSDLQKAVKVGDTVTLKYVRTDDLYATEIIKK